MAELTSSTREAARRLPWLALLQKSGEGIFDKILIDKKPKRSVSWRRPYAYRSDLALQRGEVFR